MNPTHLAYLWPNRFPLIQLDSDGFTVLSDAYHRNEVASGDTVEQALYAASILSQETDEKDTLGAGKKWEPVISYLQQFVETPLIVEV